MAPAGHSEGSGHGNSSSHNIPVVKPGTGTGEICGITNPNKQTPDAGDKPSKNKEKNRK